jgi:tRNA-(ms[2]io[6]A)-hydroxylase
MLSLQSSTSPAWVERVRSRLDEVLIDHAHCEKKAAGVAMNLIFSYVEQVDFVAPLGEIVTEELTHFRQVLDLLERRGIRFRRLKPSSYGARLNELVRKTEPERVVDRCLVAALIEARSCERFALLRDHVGDSELAAFYGSLFESEARHHATYVNFARQFASADAVASRLTDLAAAEAEIIAQGDPWVRMHS